MPTFVCQRQTNSTSLFKKVSDRLLIKIVSSCSVTFVVNAAAVANSYDNTKIQGGFVVSALSVAGNVVAGNEKLFSVGVNKSD